VLKFWRPEPKGRKMAAKKVGDFVTGTINSHFFVMGQTVTFFAGVSYLSVTDRYETRAKNVNRCPLLNLNREILKIFP